MRQRLFLMMASQLDLLRKVARVCCYCCIHTDTTTFVTPFRHALTLSQSHLSYFITLTKPHAH